MYVKQEFAILGREGGKIETKSPVIFVCARPHLTCLLFYRTTVLLETWTYREEQPCMMLVGSTELFLASPVSSENYKDALNACRCCS